LLFGVNPTGTPSEPEKLVNVPHSCTISGWAGGGGNGCTAAVVFALEPGLAPTPNAIRQHVNAVAMRASVVFIIDPPHAAGAFTPRHEL